MSFLFKKAVIHLTDVITGETADVDDVPDVHGADLQTRKDVVRQGNQFNFSLNEWSLYPFFYEN